MRQLIGRKDSAAAIAAIDRYFPGDKTPTIAEERARAYELALQACTAAPCRFAAASNANASRSTPARTSKSEAFRREVMEALVVDHIVDKPLVQRVKQLKELADASMQVLKTPQIDPVLQDIAKRAQTFADAERAKVPLLKLDVAVASDLLGPATLNDRDVPTFALDGVTAYLAVSGDGKCTGVYAVGAEAANRTYKSPTWPADRLLSQALGRPASIKAAAAGATTSRWYEAGVPVIVRWRNGDIVEIRIGDATP